MQISCVRFVFLRACYINVSTKICLLHEEKFDEYALTSLFLIQSASDWKLSFQHLSIIFSLDFHHISKQRILVLLTARLIIPIQNPLLEHCTLHKPL